MNGVIRKAKESEFGQIKDIYERICEEFKSSAYTSNWIYGEYPSDEILYSAVQDGALYVLVYNDRIVGAMVIKSEENKMMLNLLAVDPECRGQGYGQSLLSRLEDIARESECSRIEFVVVARNTPAINLYKAAGYEFSEEMIYPAEHIGDVHYYICSKRV